MVFGVRNSRLRGCLFSVNNEMMGIIISPVKYLLHFMRIGVFLAIYSLLKDIQFLSALQKFRIVVSSKVFIILRILSDWS